MTVFDRQLARYGGASPRRGAGATTSLSRRGALLGAASLAVAALRPAAASAQSYPMRPVRMIVPFVPGGGADTTARFVAEPFGKELGQSIVIENRGGAGGTIGTAAVAQAPADGYTLLYGTPGPLITNRFLMESLPYDPDKDFAPAAC